MAVCSRTVQNSTEQSRTEYNNIEQFSDKQKITVKNKTEKNRTVPNGNIQNRIEQHRKQKYKTEQGLRLQDGDQKLGRNYMTPPAVTNRGLVMEFQKVNIQLLYWDYFK